jgi:uncharacterized membrane protein
MSPHLTNHQQLPKSSSKYFINTSQTQSQTQNTEKSIEKEWNKLNVHLINMHIMSKQIGLPDLLFKTDNVWNYLHYSSFTSNENSWSQEKIFNVLFLSPQTLYLQNANSVHYIFSLFDLNNEQLIYLTLLSILLQSSRGFFILKIKTPFTPLTLDIYFLLSTLYNKVVILTVDQNTQYLVCKGFQSDYIKNHIQNIKNCLFSIRPYHLLFPHTQDSNHNGNTSNSGSGNNNNTGKVNQQMRIFTDALPLYYVSKMEEIQVLIMNKNPNA